MQKKKYHILSFLLAVLMCIATVFTMAEPVEVHAASAPSIEYRTHVQTYGWQNYVKNGALSGTTGQSKRLEGINIRLTNFSGKGGVSYRTHVQSYEWQDWKANGAMAGTSGQAKRLEAIQIKLTGDIANQYDVYYQTHIQHFGWSGWAKNGEMCGSAGHSYRLEAIKIKLVKKGGAAPGSTGAIFRQAGEAAYSGASYYKGTLVKYNAHVQSIGWQDYVTDGKTAGTSGRSKRVEAMHISLTDVPYAGNIVYNTHVQGIGWQGWRSNGQMAGTQGQAKRLEAIQIKLTGKISNYYDVYYRTHCETVGWLPWAKNGQVSGTTESSKRMEAFEIRLVRKGNAAPAGYNPNANTSVKIRNKKNIFVGDSRTCCIVNEIHKTSAWSNGSQVAQWFGNDYFGCQWGGSSNSGPAQAALAQITDNCNVFVMTGRNEVTAPSITNAYLEKAMSIARSKRNVSVYFVACGPDINANGTYNVNQFAAYNNMVNCNGVTKLNPWSELGTLIASWPGHQDLHYNGTTSRAWYNWLKAKASQTY